MVQNFQADSNVIPPDSGTSLTVENENMSSTLYDSQPEILKFSEPWFTYALRTLNPYLLVYSPESVREESPPPLSSPLPPFSAFSFLTFLIIMDSMLVSLPLLFSFGSCNEPNVIEMLFIVVALLQLIV